MSILAIMVTLNTLFSIVGLFLVIRLFSAMRKGKTMGSIDITKFVEQPKQEEVKPQIPELSKEDLQKEVANLKQEDIFAALSALGVK